MLKSRFGVTRFLANVDPMDNDILPFIITNYRHQVIFCISTIDPYLKQIILIATQTIISTVNLLWHHTIIIA